MYVRMINKHNYSNGYECTCCRKSNILDNNGDVCMVSAINLSGCDVFWLRLGTLFGNFA